MKLKLAILVSLLVLALSGLCYAQLTDYNFLGAGARAKGMGGAFFGVSDDPTAATWNPAGLTQMDKPQMGLTFKSLIPSHTFTQTYLGKREKTYDKSRSEVNFASVVIPFTLSGRDLVGSVAFQRISDFYGENLFFNSNTLIEPVSDGMVTQRDPISGDTKHTETFSVYSKLNEIYRIYQILTFPVADNGYDTLYKIHSVELNEDIEGSLNQIVLALAGKPVSNLSLGVGINVFTGGYNFSGEQSDTLRPPPNDTVLNLHPSMETDYRGFNFTVGGMFQNQNLRIGAVVKTPYTLEERQDISLIWDEVVMGVANPYTEYVPKGILYKVTQKWKLPAVFGAGVSYMLGNLTLAGDLEIRMYSNTELSYQTQSLPDENAPDAPLMDDRNKRAPADFLPPIDPTFPYRTVSLKWKDAQQFRVGAEYVLQSPWGKIPIRAGFRNDPKVFSDLNDVVIDTAYMISVIDYNSGEVDTIGIKNISYKAKETDQVQGMVFTLGTGIGWKQIMFDIAYEYSSYETKSKGKKFGNAFDELWERKDHRIFFNLTGLF
jgi:long-subunit fatty acid transport protein